MLKFKIIHDSGQSAVYYTTYFIRLPNSYIRVSCCLHDIKFKSLYSLLFTRKELRHTKKQQELVPATK